MYMSTLGCTVYDHTHLCTNTVNLRSGRPNAWNGSGTVRGPADEPFSGPASATGVHRNESRLVVLGPLSLAIGRHDTLDRSKLSPFRNSYYTGYQLLHAPHRQLRCRELQGLVINYRFEVRLWCHRSI